MGIIPLSSVVTLEGGLQPIRLPVGVAWPVGTAARDAVAVGIRGRDDAWVVSVEVEPAAVPGGKGHVAGYAGNLCLVAADDMIRVALRVVIEGTLFVAGGAFEAQPVQTTMDLMANGTGDAVLDCIQGVLTMGMDGGRGGVAAQAIGGHLSVAAIITLLQVPEAVGMPSPPPGSILLVALVFTAIAPPGGGSLTECGLDRSEIVCQGRAGPVTHREEVPAVGRTPAGMALATDLGIEGGGDRAQPQGDPVPN